ncbi:hypothetical protein ZWY2020_033371 [Hordeum vulgare]|nr:hypothetical protein ZWY2020_033371 [Hordeum vulgare]
MPFPLCPHSRRRHRRSHVAASKLLAHTLLGLLGQNSRYIRIGAQTSRPRPFNKRNEALLKLQATTINTEKGDLRPFIPVPDVARVVVDVGPRAKILTTEGGWTLRRPSEVSAAEGAGLPIDAGTTLYTLRSIGAKFAGIGKPLNAALLLVA